MRVQLSVIGDQPAAAPELTDYQRRILRLIRDGRKLYREVTEDGSRYFLDDGRMVGAPTARRIIESGEVEPAGDGMFGTTQTYGPKVAVS